MYREGDALQVHPAGTAHIRMIRGVAGMWLHAARCLIDYVVWPRTRSDYYTWP